MRKTKEQIEKERKRLNTIFSLIYIAIFIFLIVSLYNVRKEYNNIITKIKDCRDQNGKISDITIENKQYTLTCEVPEQISPEVTSEYT